MMKIDEFQAVNELFRQEKIKTDLEKYDLSNNIIDISNKSQTVYTGKGDLFIIRLPEKIVVLKQQNTTQVEAENLIRKKKNFPENYPEVYSHGEGYLILEFIKGERAWDKVLSGESIPLDKMVSHIAEIHNLSKRQLATGEINFKPKRYTDYSKSKFEKHLGSLLDINFSGAYKDMEDVINKKLNKYPHVEHIDANLYNWIGLIKIDETNNTTSVPQMTLKSMLEYGPIILDDNQLGKLYQKYCKITSLDFNEFMDIDTYANVVFHLNKVSRTLRYAIKMGGATPQEEIKGLKRHLNIFGNSLNEISASGQRVSGLQNFNNSILTYCKEGGLI